MIDFAGFALVLIMAIVPKPVSLPEDIKKFCAEKPKECGI